MPVTGNRLIARNALMLYLRMLLSMAVSLYTSRVVLQTLGVDDFGIYGVVAGLVAMFSFINTAMGGATSRFISYAIGKGSQEDVRDTFSTAMIIHMGIALAIILLAETVGLWFVERELVIPAGRMGAARLVYQFSILTMAVQVLQVPYNASIISYERMDVYAYIELLHVALKLGVVFLLLLGDFDKLVYYGLLLLLVQIAVALLYRAYCLSKFSSCRFRWVIKKEHVSKMLSFFGWNLYGTMCNVTRAQGINMVINIFFGVAVNAASSLATTVQGAIFTLAAHVTSAFRPQIIMSYARENFEKMNSLICNSIKFSLLLFLLVGVPLSVEIDAVMRLWLKEVPAFAAEFCVVVIAISLLTLVDSVLCVAIQATGNLKWLSGITGTIYLLTVPAVYLAFRSFATSPTVAYVISLSIMVAVLVADSIIVKRQVPAISLGGFFKNVAVAFALSVIAYIPAQTVAGGISVPFIRVLTVFVIYAAVLLTLTYFFGISAATRRSVNAFIAGKLRVR